MNRHGWLRGSFVLLFGYLLVPSVVYGQAYDSGVSMVGDGPALIGGQGPAVADPAPGYPPDAGPSWLRTAPAIPGPPAQPRTYPASDDGLPYRDERTVTSPQGEMTKTWDRTTTDEGSQWSREHLWTGPDGEVIRQHQWSGSQTDPYNVQREMTITLPGDRTMTHTQSRSWDGESGTMERTFQGPNGQYREQSRSWSPDDANPTSPVDPVVTMPSNLPGEAEASVGSSIASSPKAEQPDTGLFGKLKAWGKRTFGSENPSEKSTRRSGFSVGSASRSQASARASHDAVPKQNPGQVVSSLNRQNSAQHPNSSGGRSAGSRPAHSY